MAADEETAWRESSAAILSITKKGGPLAQYLPTGKKKNVRFFWCKEYRGEIMWDKTKESRPKKGPERLRYAREIPEYRGARSWFDSIDVDGTGRLDAPELASLYWLARGEKLKPKALQKAMAELDKDRSGGVSLFAIL